MKISKKLNSRNLLHDLDLPMSDAAPFPSCLRTEGSWYWVLSLVQSKIIDDAKLSIGEIPTCTALDNVSKSDRDHMFQCVLDSRQVAMKIICGTIALYISNWYSPVTAGQVGHTIANCANLWGCINDKRMSFYQVLNTVITALCD